MSAPTIPPGGTIVDTFKRSFTNVKIDEANDNAIDTSEFLEAVESLVTIFGTKCYTLVRGRVLTPGESFRWGYSAIFPLELTSGADVLGSVAFSPVKNDMLGNVKKIRDRQLSSPVDSMQVQELAVNEIKTKKHVAAEGLLWLVRGLEFTCLGLQNNLANPTQELSDSFRAAYGVTLKPHHSFLVKPIFSAAMSACPYRKDFYQKLGSDQEKVAVELKAYLDALDKVVQILKTFQQAKEAKW